MFSPQNCLWKSCANKRIHLTFLSKNKLLSVHVTHASAYLKRYVLLHSFLMEHIYFSIPYKNIVHFFIVFAYYKFNV